MTGMQDPNPLPWGALDRFQAQFIVRRDAGYKFSNYVAKTRLVTKGHFGSKAIVGARWNGSAVLTSRLNGDDKLNQMIAKQSIKNATIYVEPTETGVRIRGKWDNHLSFGITSELYEIYNTIAGHIKSI
jgi:hypothetical protein